MPFMSSYASSKAATNVWSRSLALELAPLGVSVTTATPGLIKVRQWRTASADSQTNMTASEGKPSELPASSFYAKNWRQIQQKLGSVLDASKSSVPPADQFVRGLLGQVLRSKAPRQTWGGGCVLASVAAY